MNKRKYTLSTEGRKALNARMMGNEMYKCRGTISNEASAKIIAGNKCRVWTEEQSKARSEQLKGNSHRTGKFYKHTLETKQLIKQTMSGKPKVTKFWLPDYLIPHPRIFSEVFR